MKRYTGQPLDRVDGRQKVTGQATYSAEIAVANVAHAVIVGSPVTRGTLATIDTRAAAAQPGVIAVLTHENAPKLPGMDKIGKGNGRVPQLLQDAEVRYADQPIAVVVADSPEAARHAALLVVARVDARPAAVEIEPELGNAYMPKAMPGRPAPDSTRGDVDAALEAAAVRHEAHYTTPPHHHNPMEMHATTAIWQGPAKLTLYDSTQGIFEVRQRVSDVFGIPKEAVRVISHFIGGGFGSKGSPWSHVFLAAMAAKVTGRAVKLVVTRPQMFAFVGHRPRTVQTLALGARRDGTLTAIRHEVVTYTSRYDEFTEPSANQTRMLYACDNVKTSHRLVRLDVPTPTYTRAPGQATGGFALESAMDELAVALRMDPLALRVKNHAGTDPEEHKPWSSKTLLDAYRLGAERFGWSRRKAPPRAMRDGRWLVGWGVATATYPARVRPASALARLRADGTALVQAGAQDIGTGTYTVMTQVAADALELPIEKVRFELGDTQFPEAPSSVGSTGAASVGSAVRRACEAALAELARLAGGAAPPPEQWAAVLGRAGKKELEARFDHKEDEGRKKFSCHGFGAHFVEVKVDEELGVVRVSRVVSAFGGGTILNEKLAKSQLVGGIVWGIGHALEEHGVRDVRSGRPVVRDLADYHIAVNADVPAIDVILVPEEDKVVNPVGVKGLGEIGIVGVPAAIANAVWHATGRRVRDLPITVDKMLEPVG